MTGWAFDHPSAEVSTVDSRQGPVLTTFARVAAGENEAPARGKKEHGVLHPISGSWRVAKTPMEGSRSIQPRTALEKPIHYAPGSEDGRQRG